jgi:uncharacterized membrane protein required for colicin V production
MIDIAILVLVAGYAALGYWTGLIRRVIGFVALYVAFLAATNAAPTAGSVIQQAFPNWAAPDALTLGYFVEVVIVTVVIEVLASFYHARLQLAAMVFDKPTGAVLGALTALAAATVAIYLVLGAALPPAGSPDGAQIQALDTIRKSILAPTLVRTAGQPAVILFGPVIPASPSSYFNGAGARPQ